MPDPAAFVFRDLSLGYEGRPAVQGLTGEIRAGALLALVGPNGAGKSTLLKGLVGEAAVLAGTLERPAAATGGGAIGYLPQRAAVDTTFPVSVFDFAAMGGWHRTGPWRRIGRAEEDRVADALRRVSLLELARRPIGSLSGGQMQRALFARTVVQDARTILLDEPLTAVDESTADDLVAIVAGWHREGRTVVAALHETATVRMHFPDILLLDGRPLFWGPTAEAAERGWLRSGRFDRTATPRPRAAA